MTADTTVRVAVAGARGKTGRVVTAALEQAAGISVVAKLVRAQAQAQAAEFEDLQALAAAAQPNVLVDFTTFPASKRIALEAIGLGIRPVIGTSGYQPRDLKEIREASGEARVGAVYAPNFAIGAVLMFSFARSAARHFNFAEIIETHQQAKKDAPSGTALALAAAAGNAGSMRRAASQNIKLAGAMGAELAGVGIHSLRVPGAIARHEIRFANDWETLSISHDTTARAAFVPGVVAAVDAVMRLDHFVEGLEELV